MPAETTVISSIQTSERASSASGLTYNPSAFKNFPDAESSSKCPVEHEGVLIVKPSKFCVAGTDVTVRLYIKYEDALLSQDLFIIWNGKGSLPIILVPCEISLHLTVDTMVAKYSGTILASRDSPMLSTVNIEAKKFRTNVDMREATAAEKIRHGNEVMAAKWYSTLCRSDKDWAEDRLLPTELVDRINGWLRTSLTDVYGGPE